MSVTVAAIITEDIASAARASIKVKPRWRARA
jgi:hypothetical protein